MRDVVIIGGGAGGLVVASVAAQLGLDVVLINKEENMGGDCLHYGCVPSKTLIKSASVAHAMAHADRRHSTRQLTKSVGISLLLNAALGDKQSVEQIIGALVNLQFSRGNEAEADEYSVRFLCPSPYNAAGSAGFFKKMLNQPTPPEFLSTHPSPKNRVKNIESLKEKLGCKGTRTNMVKYSLIKKMIK